MKDLKEYIEESLLDNFNALNDRTGEAVEKHNPWAIFWKKVQDQKSWKSFDEGLEELMAVLSTGAELTTVGVKVPKGRVLVSLHTDSTHSTPAILVEYNKSNWKSGRVFRGSDPWMFIEGENRSFGSREQDVHLRPGVQKTCGRIRLKDKKGYLLNETYSKQAIDMLHKLVNHDWFRDWYDYIESL